MRYLLLSIIVVCMVGIMIPSAFGQIGPNYGSVIEPEILGLQALGLLGLVFLIVVPTALVILVVIAIKQMRKKKSS